MSCGFEATTCSEVVACGVGQMPQDEERLVFIGCNQGVLFAIRVLCCIATTSGYDSVGQ